MDEVSAYHESGHVLMAVLSGAKVISVTIEPDFDDGPRRHGDTKIEWPVSMFSRKQLLEKIVRVTLAGPVAEMIHTGDPFHPGFVPEWKSDWDIAWESANELITDEKNALPGWNESVLTCITCFHTSGYPTTLNLYGWISIPTTFKRV